MHQGPLRYLAFMLCWFVAFLPAYANAEEARVAVAANFKPVMDVIEPAFEAETGHDLIISTGGTGSLYAQIRNGAPYDVFMAADEARPALLEEEGIAAAGTRFTYAIGQLVLWAPHQEEFGAAQLQSLSGQRVAVAQAELAPYGRAAEEAINALGLSPKLVRGGNIGQAFAFVKTGNADYGFVALSQILMQPEEARGSWWVVTPSLYSPIRQDAVLLSHGAENEAAIVFLAFLQSAAGHDLIERYGYGLP